LKKPAGLCNKVANKRLHQKTFGDFGEVIVAAADVEAEGKAAQFGMIGEAAFPGFPIIR